MNFDIDEIKRRAGITEMANPHSKKRLFAFFDEVVAAAGGNGRFVELGLKHPRISNETYGRDSHIYLSTGNPQAREKIERNLKKNGFRVNSNYSPGSGTVDVQVSYFKGHHWDESSGR